MKFTNLQNVNVKILFFITLFTIYHYYIHNGLEKTFSQQYIDYSDVKRPLLKCSNKDNSLRLGCIGMPSGHAETTSIFCFLLYFYKIIPLWVCIFFILIVSIQRVVSHMHTPGQVIMGSILGLFYASIYKYFNLSIIGFLLVFSIGFMLVLLSIYKIDQQVYGPIPNWVDKTMYDSIKKKQNSPLYIKVGSLYANSFIQSVTFMKWYELEHYLDKMVERIKQSGIDYHAVVGIKTGGAIISDYISLKLGLPNYKIKLTREEYNCNKKANNTIDDIMKKNFTNNQGKFTICEGIQDNIEGKNIILVDELVSTGITMEESYDYLKEQKYANIVYPTCIGFYKSKYKGSLHINNILNDTVLIWPWGYDN
jgi:hypoxanthine phosphoribosyltransferase